MFCYYLEEDTFRVICACFMEKGVLGCVRTELIGIANNPFLSLFDTSYISKYLSRFEGACQYQKDEFS